MRLRNVKNKDIILDSSKYFIKEPFVYKGKWKTLFKNDNPIYIEIGMGKGKFIMNNALMNKDINYIGIEKSDSIIAKSLQRIPDGINNLYIINVDAMEIDNVFDKEIEKIFLNFSDPWPKKRHSNRRLSSPVFLKKYDNIFVLEKCIEMRTDNKDLYTYSLLSFSNYGYILNDISLDLHHDNMPDITTEYEDKFSELNMPIYYVKCVKK